MIRWGGGLVTYKARKQMYCIENKVKICRSIKVKKTKLVGLTTNETLLKLHVRLSKQTNFYLML